MTRAALTASSGEMFESWPLYMYISGAVQMPPPPAVPAACCFMVDAAPPLPSMLWV